MLVVYALCKDNARGTWRIGAALHAEHGNTDSREDFNSTHNDVDFWGISLYQSWRNGRVNITGDIGYNASDGISANLIEKTTFAGQIGVKLLKGDMRWGLGYSVNTSSHNNDQMINATWQLSF
ncbi:autotransporter domain-containing protein [Salmonella enterica subsp. arizonae]|nr:autotransporter domain-containing protein [Salmonella enterica]